MAATRTSPAGDSSASPARIRPSRQLIWRARKPSDLKLSAARQDEVISALEQGKATGFSWPSAQAFFNTLRTHTIEGMFADPVYGGNKDFAGWRLVGFPGAHPAFTPADMASKEAFRSEAFRRAPGRGDQRARAGQGHGL